MPADPVVLHVVCESGVTFGLEVAAGLIAGLAAVAGLLFWRWRVLLDAD